ncbi:MAG TPA: tripartite tricarboxylate transporter substrate binding protein [Alphaproteobacteria bacterium]
MIRVSKTLSALALFLAFVGPAAAYPDRPVRIVVPFPPGGGTDIISRTLGSGMSKDLGQPVVIENKPGGGTILGTAQVANAPADGYTLVMATFAHAVNPSLKASLPYDTDKAFQPVALVARSYNILVVNPNSRFKTVQDLLAAAKANPGKLNYGSFGIGTSAHLAGELFKYLGKVDLTHVAYQGAAAALTDLMAGQIDAMFTTVASVSSYIQAEQLRALAVTSAKRSPAVPDLPTIAEAGVPGYVAESWYGLYAPSGTPRDVVARLNKSAAEAVKSDGFKKLETVEGLTVAVGSPDELDRYVRGEEARWRDVVQAAHIEPQ